MLIIKKLGYGGIFVSTGLEYACFPISSELLLPFIGFSVFKGQMNLFYTILASTLGGMAGCSFCYFVGRFGEHFINRTLCRRFRTIAIGIQHAKQYFKKYGKQSVLIARVFPIARTYISIPAGMAKMDFRNFLLYSTIGALVWNTVLISLGYFLGDHWSGIAGVLKENQFLLIGILFACILFFWYKKGKKKKRMLKR